VAGLVWLRIGTGGELFGFHEMLGDCQVASRVVLSSIELVIHCVYCVLYCLCSFVFCVLFERGM
jgi:hypothetical protein